MRKVKVLALLLAALMVVAVFAGCADTDAIVADVENLDERVEALENLLNNQKDAIDDVKDQLGDVSDKLDNDTTAAQLEAVLKALEEQQKELQEQLKELGDKVTKVEEDNKESDENADDDAALQAAVKVYTAKLQELKITCELAKDGYVPADYEAVVKALSDAIVAIADAKTAADVEKLYNDAKAVYDAKATVYTKLVNYYNQVKNNVSAESKDLIAEIKAFIKDDTTVTPTALCPVTVVYGSNPGSEAALNYKNGEKKTDGTDVVVNLYTELDNAVKAYEYVTGTAFATLVETAVNAIDAIETVLLSEATKVTTAKTAYEAVATAVSGTGDKAAYLADSNLALVTNAADLTAAEARLGTLVVAQAMYKTIGKVVGSTVVTPFAEYNALTNKLDHNKKDVYDAINAVIAKWVAAYALDEDNVAYIIDNAYTGADDTTYATYLANNETVNLYDKACADFAAIANRIATLNKVTVLDTAAFAEYDAITDAIEAWKVVRQDDKTTTENEYLALNDFNFATILVEYKLAVDSEKVPADNKLPELNFAALNFAAKQITADANYYGLYKFVDTAANDFFATTFSAASTDADAINTAIENLIKKENELPSIKDIIILEGTYLALASNANIYAESKVTYTADNPETTDVDEEAWAYENVKDATVAVTPGDAAVNTVAEFKAKYVTDKYDLSVLLDLAELAALKKAVSDKIAGFKTTGAEVVALIEAVDAVLVEVGATGYDKYDEGDTNVKYLVTLADKAAVGAAQAAYDAWVAAGASSGMREFTAYVDPTTEKVVDGQFVFGGIIDTDALAVQISMNAQVNKLTAVANELVKYYTLTKQAHDYGNKKVVIGKLGDKAITNVTKTTHEYTNETKTTYKGVIKNSTIIVGSETFDTVTISDALDATTSIKSYTELLTSAFALYDAFMALNAEYYYDEDGALQVKAETYKAVEDAKALNAAFELVYVKNAVINSLTAKIAKVNDNTIVIPNHDKAEIMDYLTGCVAQITGASNYTQIFNIMKEIYVNTNALVTIDPVSVGGTVVVRTVVAADVA